jgi:hypothetical protein
MESLDVGLKGYLDGSLQATNQCLVHVRPDPPQGSTDSRHGRRMARARSRQLRATRFTVLLGTPTPVAVMTDQPASSQTCGASHSTARRVLLALQPARGRPACLRVGVIFGP